MARGKVLVHLRVPLTVGEHRAQLMRPNGKKGGSGNSLEKVGTHLRPLAGSNGLHKGPR